jgi:hypothetical protein
MKSLLRSCCVVAEIRHLSPSKSAPAMNQPNPSGATPNPQAGWLKAADEEDVGLGGWRHDDHGFRKRGGWLLGKSLLAAAVIRISADRNLALMRASRSYAAGAASLPYQLSRGLPPAP